MFETVEEMDRIIGFTCVSETQKAGELLTLLFEKSRYAYDVPEWRVAMAFILGKRQGVHDERQRRKRKAGIK